MVNNISFGSAYKAYITKDDVKNGRYGHSELTDFLDNYGIEYKQTFIHSERVPAYAKPFKTNISDQYVPAINDYAVSKYTIVALDDFDQDIETICANRGIKFEKVDEKELTNMASIIQRTKPAEEGYTLAVINSEKLEKLIENQDTNLDHCERDYNDYYREKTEIELKSGDEFSPQKLNIINISGDGSPEDLKRYVDTFGVENLNDQSISIWLETEDEKATYFGLKDMGLKHIPVYLDKESYVNAYALGLLN